MKYPLFIDSSEGNGGNLMSSRFNDLTSMTQVITYFKCPLKNGRWPKLDNCEHFVECIDGEPQEVSCPSDLYYNPAIRGCDFPDAVECPYKCPSKHGEFSLVGDCSSYILCSDGVPTLMVCDEGLHWNPTRQLCDLPEDADCPLKCEVENGTFPYIGDCQSYISCQHGVPHLRKCPPGLTFSLTIYSCAPDEPGLCPLTLECSSHGSRFPLLWDCKKFLECTKDDFDSSSIYHVIVKNCPKGLLYNHITEECESTDRRFCANSCPSPNGFFQISGLCNYYKVCNDGIPELFTCPHGMHYNPVRQECDWPSLAGCIPKCIELNGVNGIPGKCTQYIVCVDGIAKVKHCPNQLHFNQLLKLCDTPENAKCEFTCPQTFGFYLMPGKCEDYYECRDGEAFLQHCPSQLHFNNRIKMCDLPERARCLNTCPKPYGIFPVEGDCSAFIECEHNVPSIRTCGRGYYFNALSAQCDLVENVLCDPKCPSPNGRFHIPGARQKIFLECKKNVPTVRTCSDGLHFNELIENCELNW